ncbi:hypothetical protein [Labrys miyagiensis]|uniref:hypothetical protein n=1 Tax=Labrys miyagiensis TaxID=346912 RepID=UPI0024E0530A|nr:hypothetical protein [Labrys miyagiensis]
MRYILITLCLAASAATFAPTSANAVVCARGVVRAGCAGPRGAVVVRKPVAVAPVVRPRCAIVNGRRVCR